MVRECHGGMPMWEHPMAGDDDNSREREARCKNFVIECRGEEASVCHSELTCDLDEHRTASNAEAMNYPKSPLRQPIGRRTTPPRSPIKVKRQTRTSARQEVQCVHPKPSIKRNSNSSLNSNARKPTRSKESAVFHPPAPLGCTEPGDSMDLARCFLSNEPSTRSRVTRNASHDSPQNRMMINGVHSGSLQSPDQLDILNNPEESAEEVERLENALIQFALERSLMEANSAWNYSGTNDFDVSPSFSLLLDCSYASTSQDKETQNGKMINRKNNGDLVFDPATMPTRSVSMNKTYYCSAANENKLARSLGGRSQGREGILRTRGVSRFHSDGLPPSQRNDTKAEEELSVPRFRGILRFFSDDGLSSLGKSPVVKEHIEDTAWDCGPLQSQSNRGLRPLRRFGSAVDQNHDLQGDRNNCFLSHSDHGLPPLRRRDAIRDRGPNSVLKHRQVARFHSDDGVHALQKHDPIGDRGQESTLESSSLEGDFRPKPYLARYRSGRNPNQTRENGTTRGVSRFYSDNVIHPLATLTQAKNSGPDTIANCRGDSRKNSEDGFRPLSELANDSAYWKKDETGRWVLHTSDDRDKTLSEEDELLEQVKAASVKDAMNGTIDELLFTVSRVESCRFGGPINT